MRFIDNMLVKSEHDNIWEKYCGFLDLSLQQFLSMQEILLFQQLEKYAPCPLWNKFLRNRIPTSIDEFRYLVPLTTYEDYLPELDAGDESALPEKPYIWAHTSGASGSFKRIPYTHQSYIRLLDRLMSIFILACSKRRGQSLVSEGDRVLFNVAPKPYLSGILASGASEIFNFRPLMRPDVHDDADFHEKIAEGFKLALKDGVDILIAMTSVLVKMGSDMSNHMNNGHLTMRALHPNILRRFALAWLKSRIQKRNILPRDLWPVKALIGWGIDTDIYREHIRKYWGMYPYEFHGFTEAGIIAMQSWNRKNMTFVPDLCFLEFIPEDELIECKRNAFHQPNTILLSEVEPGKRYELVITSFYGMPFIRYRPGHLIRITSLADKEAEIYLPQIIFEGRSDDTIDIAGFTRLSEKTVMQAIANTGLMYEDWMIRKKIIKGQDVLHIYIELYGEHNPMEVASALHHELKKIDPFYCDLESMMDFNNLEVTLLHPGTFRYYYGRKERAGTKLDQLKTSRMNAPDDVISEIISLSDIVGHECVVAGR